MDNTQEGGSKISCVLSTTTSARGDEFHRVSRSVWICEKLEKIAAISPESGKQTSQPHQCSQRQAKIERGKRKEGGEKKKKRFTLSFCSGYFEDGRENLDEE